MQNANAAAAATVPATPNQKPATELTPRDLNRSKATFSRAIRMGVFYKAIRDTAEEQYKAITASIKGALVAKGLDADGKASVEHADGKASTYQQKGRKHWDWEELEAMITGALASGDHARARLLEEVRDTCTKYGEVTQALRLTPSRELKAAVAAVELDTLISE